MSRDLVPPALPFGKHKGRPLADVPTDYLRWVLRETKLSARLAAAVRAELASRGQPVPPPAASPWSRCRDCRGQLHASWVVHKNGSRHIRAECVRCGWTTHLPQTPANIALAEGSCTRC
jgi:hypothetical protein